MASAVELTNSVDHGGRAGALLPFFDIVKAIVLHSHGDVFFLSFGRDKWSSNMLGLGSWLCARKTIKGIAPNGDQ